MPSPPSGRVAFLFTDLEGSTAYWERRPESMPAVYERHDAILRAVGDQIRVKAGGISGSAEVMTRAADKSLPPTRWRT